MNELPKFKTLAEIFAEEDAKSQAHQLQVEEEKKALLERLEALCKAIPDLTAGGFYVQKGAPLTECFDEVWMAFHWLSSIPKCDAISKNIDSYGFKHIAEKMMDHYISNGAMIAAAYLSGFDVVRGKTSLCPNARFNIENKVIGSLLALANNGFNFRDLAVLEPRLKVIAGEINAYRIAAKFKDRCCANERWYGYREWERQGFKARLSQCVGFEARNRLLKSSEAYDVAYRALYKKLPNCKNCSCVGVVKQDSFSPH